MYLDRYFIFMKTIIMFLIMLTVAQAQLKHLPSNSPYQYGDSDYTQYSADSLLHTSTYSLTFDDGPNKNYTPQILDHLKSYNVKATFFIVGSRVNESDYPLLKRILNEGHILASHDWTHDNNNNENREIFKKDLRKSIQKIETIYNRLGFELPIMYFRFPYAAYGRNRGYHHLNVIRELSQEMYNQNCIHFAFWDNDSGDWIPGMDGEQIFQNFKAFEQGGRFYTYKIRNGKIIKVTDTIPGKKVPQINKGGVILFHDMYQKTVDGVAKILKYASQRNIRFVNLNEIHEYQIHGNYVCRLN